MSDSGQSCCDANRDTRKDLQRADKLSAVSSPCGCEKHRISKYSPGIIGGEELLTRFIFSPMHTNSRGVVKPSLFEHVHSRGCSIQRDSIAKDVEINSFITNFLSAGNGRFSWLGVVSAKCSDVRDIRIDRDADRAMCVFDTAEPNNPSHGEICRARVVDEADKVELRHSLWRAFNGSAIVKPSDYRIGKIGDRASDKV